MAIYGPPAATAGPTVGSLVAGVAAILVSLVVACFGVADLGTSAGGAPGGWGLLVGGAFAILAGFLGLVGVGLGVVGLRQTRRVARAVAPHPGAWPTPMPGWSVGAPGAPLTGGPGAVPRTSAGEPVRGRGMAIAGLSCGGAALLVTLCSMGLAALAAF